MFNPYLVFQEKIWLTAKLCDS